MLLKKNILIKLVQFITLIFICVNLKSQSIDSINTVKFASFLEDSKLHKFAAEEYERLYFYYPHESSFFNKMLKNYRLSGNIKAISQRINNNTIKSDTAIIIYTLGLIDAKQYEEATQVLKYNSNLVPIEIRNRLELDLKLIKGEYKSALTTYNANEMTDTSYLSRIVGGIMLPRKSPLIAGIMSGLIPGSGRAYAHDYKDGIVSLIFVASTGYQAYRRFKDKGVKSVSGWIYGGLTLGFYIGNIYGSVSSAKMFNQKKRDEYNVNTKNYLDLYYSDL